ncbi:hypothetical protein Ade02nite_30500 [Paractinoplanes deccanensis]|uniref:Peptide deformylase n=1 Tax=Paractinoplanes deccanensis TaxID=113561 RepID=A0ABQ3Y337_9ACTN|nr:hypothetical protein Ade02nite_30500 [Actinoplanes deccanensis]
MTGTGLLARCLQHEADHLDGILCIDRQDDAEHERLMATLRDTAWFEG